MLEIQLAILLNFNQKNPVHTCVCHGKDLEQYQNLNIFSLYMFYEC